MKLYLARAMTGRDEETVRGEAAVEKCYFEMFGHEVLCPVAKERRKSGLMSPPSLRIWLADKALLRQADMVLDMTPHRKSFGVEKEIGYAQFGLRKPVVRVFHRGEMPPKGSILYYEDYAVVEGLSEALKAVKSFERRRHAVHRENGKVRAGSRK